MRGQPFFYLEISNDEAICTKSWLMFSCVYTLQLSQWRYFDWVDAFGRNPIEINPEGCVLLC